MNTHFVFIGIDLFRINTTFWQDSLSENSNTVTQNKEIQIFFFNLVVIFCPIGRSNRIP